MLLTVYGAGAVALMMFMYALEQRSEAFILGFALGCLLSSAYGFLAGAWPVGVAELVWCAIAVRRYRRHTVGHGRASPSRPSKASPVSYH